MNQVPPTPEADAKEEEVYPGIVLTTACRVGNKRIVELLLKHPSTDASARNSEALRVACAAGDSSIVSMLLQRPEVDASACNNEALRTAVSRNDFFMTSLLLARPEVDPMTPTQNPSAPKNGGGAASAMNDSSE